MNKRFFNQQNLTRRLRLLPVLFAMLLMPLSAWAQTITVAGVSPDTDGNFIDEAHEFITSGTVTFDAGTNTLTLDNATIIPANGNNGIDYSGTGALTISLKGSNTISCSGVGIIQHSGTLAPTLAFTKGGTEPCSLQLGTIGVDLQTIGGFEDVSCATGLYRIDDTTGGDAGTTYKTTITSLGGGSGTSSDPIIIKTAEDLRDFAKLVNKGTITNEYIKLNPEGGELDCNGLTGFEPIGILINSSYNYPFIGKFDGNNCTIKNLTYSTNGTGDRVGLFGYVGNEDVSDTKIEKLTLSNCSFNGGEYVGGIVGELKNGTIENCVLSSCTVKSGNAQIPYTGGIAGWVDNGTINTCTFNSGLVDCTTAYSGEPSGGVYAGGIVGYIYSTNSVTVSLCTVSSTNVKSVHSGSDGAYDIYVGGIVGCSLGTSTIAISGNKVTTTDNTKKISCQSSVDYTNYHCGAIIGEKGDETSLTNNTYEYDVTTDIAGTTKSGYTQRGIGGTTYNTTTQQYEPNPDVFTNNGAVMDTRLLAMPGESSPVTALGDEGGYYAYATGSTYGILGAPGKPVKVTINPNGNTITDVSVTYGIDQTATITKTKTEEGISFYTISEMPDADDATLNVTCDIAYDLWIGETQVTDANKDHILGEGNTSVKFAVTGNEAAGYVSTLTLNGAALTVPVIVGLDNLTIDIQGTNSITTEERCIQKMEDTTPAVTFTSTSAEVGNLTLKGAAGVNDVGEYNVGSFTISDKLALVLKSGGFLYSDQYRFTDGATLEAKLSPSYGVTVGKMQICPDNAADVIGEGIGDGDDSGLVSFDKESSTLTLTNASLSGIIRSSLPDLTIELVGNNSIYSGGDRILQAGVAVNMTIQSSATVKGSLSMQKGYSSTELGNFVDDNVNLTISAPLSVVSGSLTDNSQENDYYATIGVDYGLTVAGVTVTSVNAANVLGDDETATVVFTPANATEATPATLTLNGATITGSIVSGLENLKVVINGANTAVGVSASTVVGGDKNITFVGGTNGSTLTISAEDGGSAVSGFASVSYDGAYAAANVPFGYGKPDSNSPKGYVKSHMMGDNSYLETLTITTVPHYPIWLYKDVTTATQVNNTNKNTLINTLLNASGNISFDGSNILTLQNVNCEARIVSGLSELTISIDGDCIIESPDSGSVVRSINSAAPLTIEKASGASSASLKLATVSKTAVKAFASLDYTGLILLSNGATYTSGALNDSDGNPLNVAIFTSSLKKPTLRMYYPDVDNFSGAPYYKFVNPNGGGTVKYSRYFASESIHDEINQTYDEDDSFDVKIDYKWAPVVCKVWVEANGSVSDTLYACRLDVENMEATYGDTNVPVPTLLPQAVDGVTTTYALRDTDVETHAANITSDGTISLLSPGQEWLKATFTVGDGVEYIKNASNEVPSAEFYIVVKPSKPTLSHETGSYAGTQTVTFTDEFVDNQNITAWYYTYEGEEPADPTVNPVPDGGIPVSSSENVAVYYRLRYDENDNVDLFAYSDTTNVAITILEDIDNCTVTGNGNVTYTGVAQTPTLTVTPAVGGEALVLGTDYTVSYKKGETAVESMIDAGDYTIVITAKEGSAYGGTKEVDFTIDQANLGDVTIAPIADQTYTGSQITPTDITVTFNEKTVSTEEYNVVYGENKNVGEGAGTVTLTSKNKNFVTSTDADATTKQTATFNIVAATAAITATDQTVTFDGEEQPFTNYTIANGEAVVTYYSSEEARTAKTGGTTNAPTNAAIYYVQVTQGDDNYTSAPANATFTISPKALTEGMVEQDGVSFTYSGYTPEYSVSVKDGEEYLAGDDYDCVIKQGGTEIIPVNAGSYDVVVTGKRNYTGTITKTLTITKAQLTVTPDDKTYNVGDDITLTVKITGFVEGEDEGNLTTQPTASYGTADVTKPGSYEITASGGEAQNYDFVYKTGTLTINRVLDVSFSDNNDWVTYYGTENLATPEGLQAYIVTAVGTSAVTTSAIDYIPANTAVLLKDVEGKAASANIVASAYEGETTTFPDNILQGGVAVDVSTITGGTVYVLYNNMFKRATGGTIPANRGYLVVEPSAVNAGNAPQLSITIGDENTTAISNTDFTDNTDKAGEWYSIDGVKLNGQPQKPGLYIKNGKKVFINKK